MIHFLSGWKSHLFHELPRVLPQANAHKLEHKCMEEQGHNRTHTHIHTLTQTTTQSISVRHVLSPESGVNTNALFSG